MHRAAREIHEVRACVTRRQSFSLRWALLSYVSERSRPRMFFCSTCKRYREDAKRKPNRKTCSNCLKKKSAERARTRRARRNADTNNRGLTSKKGDLRFCSSCKCEKTLENFFGNHKSCQMCLLRRRLAKIFKVSPVLVQECFCRVFLLRDATIFPERSN